MNHLFNLALLIIFMATCFLNMKPAHANGEYSIIIPQKSHHYKSPKNNPLNEVNEGIGLEYRPEGSSIGVNIVYYKNSFDNNSLAGAISYEKCLNETICTGIDAGVVSGYDKVLKPFVRPNVSIGATQIGVLPDPNNPVVTISKKFTF